MKVLLVDDQRSARQVLADIVRQIGNVSIFQAEDLTGAKSVLMNESIDLALVDIRLGPDLRNRDGLELVGFMRKNTTTVPVIVTISNEMEQIRAAMRLGAYDYILKDALCEELVVPIVESVRKQLLLEREVSTLRARCAIEQIPGIVGSSAVMERLRAIIRRVALSDRPVLITGPTGVGKELVAAAIHALGPHPAEPIIDVNCGAIPESLMEGQLFGYERGAFTGADRRQEGNLSAVRQGTLFLDEIAELPVGLQPKLLRVLETNRFRSLGSNVERVFAGRVVAATHADLGQRVSESRFREDLLYRLNVLEIRVPALDERKSDIPELAGHFARRQSRPLRFSRDAVDALMARSWPGNVRELRNFVDRLAVFSDEELVTACTFETIPRATQRSAASIDLVRATLQLSAPNKLHALEQAVIEGTLALTDGNKSAAARLLGVHRKAIERRHVRVDGDPT
jgi:DNA-binding NtrC family response regulator